MNILDLGTEDDRDSNVLSDDKNKRLQGVVLLCLLYVKQNVRKDDDKKGYGRKAGPKNYDKMLFFYDVNAPTGQNVVIVFHGTMINESMFSQCINIRDTQCSE